MFENPIGALMMFDLRICVFFVVVQWFAVYQLYASAVCACAPIVFMDPLLGPVR